jgi:phage-related tail fiber protein
MEEKKWDAADATLTEIGKLMPETRQTAVSVARLPILVGKGELAAALALVDSLSEKNKTNATALANLAWKLVTDEHLQGKLLAAGYQLAVKANEVAGGKDPIVLDTLARATFLQGDKETAVALERKAVDVADNDSLKRPLRATLDSYKDGKLPLAN